MLYGMEISWYLQLMEEILHHLLYMKSYGIFSISTGDRRISEASTVSHHEGILCLILVETTTRWWFQIFLFLPLPGEMIQFG